jgi:AcrR family transcriptional regulator
VSSPKQPPRTRDRAAPAVRQGRGGGRDRILGAAMELFGNRGYSDVSMRDVSEAAGVTKAALYYHFADKADLFTTVALRRIDEIREAMDSAARSGTLEERLLRMATIGYERMQTDVYTPHLMAHEHLDAAHHQQLHDAMDRLQEPVVRCFEEAGPQDPAITPRAASELLAGVLFSLIFAPEAEGGGRSPLPADQTERALLAIRLFLRGYWSLASGDESPPA